MIENKTDGHLNRSRGDNWELDCLKYLMEAGYSNIGTSRLWSEEMDKLGVDIVSQDEELYGYFPYHLSIKATSSLVNYPQLLDNLPRKEGIINTIFHKKYYKGEVIGSYAILDIKNFLNLIKK